MMRVQPRLRQFVGEGMQTGHERVGATKQVDSGARFALAAQPM